MRIPVCELALDADFNLILRGRGRERRRGSGGWLIEWKNMRYDDDEDEDDDFYTYMMMKHISIYKKGT